MRRFRRFSAILIALLLVLGVVSSCTNDAPAAPAVPEPNTALIGDLLGTTGDILGTTVSTVTGLLSCPHTESYHGSRVIGRDGGLLKVGPHSLYVPPRALDRDIRITADAPAGSTVRVEFEPEGLRFQRQPLLTLSYKDCGLLSLPLAIVYADDQLNILEVLTSLPNLFTQTVSARIKHFSWYALAD